MSTGRRGTDIPTYSSVDELIEREPLVVDGNTAVGEVARRMTERGVPAAVVRIGAGQFGLVTDSLLRARVLVAGRPTTTPVQQIMDTTVPTVPATPPPEALMLMLERDAEFLLVTDRTGELRGRLPPRLRHLPHHCRGLTAREAAPGHQHRGAGHIRRPSPADAR